MLKIKDIAQAIEDFAPLSLQESYDNAGLIVGREEDSVNGALLAVDLREEVIDEALELGVDMIITHHPIIFSPLKRFNSASYVERCVERAIRNNIAIYAAHTNLDSAQDGMSWRLGQMLALEGMQPLSSTNAELGAGFGVVGEWSLGVPMEEAICRVANSLNLKALRHSDLCAKEVRCVAICTGSGGSLIKAATASGADLYITADLRYNDFLDTAASLTVLDIGHFESEYCGIDILFDVISKKIVNFALYKSRRGKNPVHYRHF